jgi:hypothetical protein
MSKAGFTEADTYMRLYLSQVEENSLLKRQLAQEVSEKYAAYKRIAELIEERAASERYGAYKKIAELIEEKPKTTA